MTPRLDWEACKAQRVAKPVAPNLGRVRSLLASARNREATVALLPLNDTTKETAVSLHYDVLREVLEALAIERGFKIYNHECYTGFLYSVIHDEPLALEFDSLRQLRNGINYYGGKIRLDDAKAAIERIKAALSKARGLMTANKR